MPVTTVGNVTYSDLPEGWSEEFTPDGVIAHRRVQTAWSAVSGFPAYMLGTNTKIANKIFRTKPEVHPVRNYLHCTECKLTNGIGYPNHQGGGVGNFGLDYKAHGGGDGLAVWDLIYTDLPYDIVDDAPIHGGNGNLTELDRFVEKRKDYASESLTMTGTTWKFSGDNETVKEASTKRYPTQGLWYTWWWVPEPLNEAVFAAAIGKVNNAAWDHNIYGAETLLLKAVETTDHRVRDAAGNKCRHVVFHFIHRATGWNKFWRRNNGAAPAFEAIVDKATGTVKPYETYTFDSLFLVG